jgi:hypothetical protein
MGIRWDGMIIRNKLKKIALKEANSIYFFRKAAEI